MAIFDATPWLGARTVRPTDAQLLTLQRYDHALGDAGIALAWRHMGYFMIPFTIGTAINDNAKSSLEYTARIPFMVVGAEVGVESAAGSACIADIEKNPAGGADTFATMSTGAVDVKTGAAEFQNLPILDGAEEVAAGDQLRLTVTGTGAGAVVGANALLHCIRL
jgi:hypothetical protein